MIKTNEVSFDSEARNNKFALDTRSIEQMLNDYEAQKQAVEARCLDEISTDDDYDRLPLEDQQLLSDYADSVELLNETRKALDFAKTSTMQFLYMDFYKYAPREGWDELRISSLMESETDYAKAVVTLTGGFDKRMQGTLESLRTEPFHSEAMTFNEYRATISAAPANDIIRNAITQEIGNCNIMKDKTVADLVGVIASTKELREEKRIRDENLIDDTLSVISAEREADTLFVLDVDRYERIAQKEKSPIEIVESNDGYVMNTSEKITPENSRELPDNIENGNEVRHALPRETTNSTADIRANVKLEGAKDIGTKEQTEIDAGYGTDTDIEIAARTSETYEAQTDNRQKKQDNER